MFVQSVVRTDSLQRLRGSAEGTVSDALLAIELVEETLVVKYGTSLLGFKAQRRNILSYHHHVRSTATALAARHSRHCAAEHGVQGAESPLASVLRGSSGARQLRRVNYKGTVHAGLVSAARQHI